MHGRNLPGSGGSFCDADCHRRLDRTDDPGRTAEKLVDRGFRRRFEPVFDTLASADAPLSAPQPTANRADRRTAGPRQRPAPLRVRRVAPPVAAVRQAFFRAFPDRACLRGLDVPSGVIDHPDGASGEHVEGDQRARAVPCWGDGARPREVGIEDPEPSSSATPPTQPEGARDPPSTADVESTPPRSSPAWRG